MTSESAGFLRRLHLPHPFVLLLGGVALDLPTPTNGALLTV